MAETGRKCAGVAEDGKAELGSRERQADIGESRVGRHRSHQWGDGLRATGRWTDIPMLPKEALSSGDYARVEWLAREAGRPGKIGN
jgi:hypothetical protein